MNRQARREHLRRATRATQAAGGNPEVAAELERLRAVRQGAYALMHVLVSRAGGGPIEIPRGDWKALPPGEVLKVKVDPETDDATLWIERRAD